MYDNYLLYFVGTNQYYPLQKGQDEIAGKSRDKSTLYLIPYFEGPITTISRRHFKLSYRPHGLFIEDLGSKNGTEVNDVSLFPKNRKRLFHGDTIRIAKKDDFIIEVIDENSGTDVICTGAIQPEPPTIPAHGLYFHEHENTFYLDGQSIDGLEPRAIDLLKYLYQHKKQEMSYYEILKNVFTLATTEHSVRAAVKDIRATFEKVSPGSKMRYLKTVRSVGYKLVIEWCPDSNNKIKSPSAYALGLFFFAQS